MLEKFSVDDKQITQTSGKIIYNDKNVQGSHQLTSPFSPTCFCCLAYKIDLPWIGGEGEEYIGGSLNHHSSALLVNCGPLLHLLFLCISSATLDCAEFSFDLEMHGKSSSPCSGH